MKVSGKTRLLGIIGTPVSHSKSPEMYNYCFQKLGLDYLYLAFDVSIPQVPEAISAMRTFNMLGMNVTMPCKTAVLEHMDEVSTASRIIGACNTIVNDDGKLTGHITDGGGFVRNLRENGVSVKDKKIVIMGAGGAATAIIVESALQGAKEISIFTQRDEFYDKTQQRLVSFKTEIPNCRFSLTDLAETQCLYDAIVQSDNLINATLIGMKPYEKETLIENTDLFRKDLVVADVVYNPSKTRMILEAEEKGCKAIGGMGMLLYQGVEAFELYTGMEMPVEEVKALFFQE